MTSSTQRTAPVILAIAATIAGSSPVLAQRHGGGHDRPRFEERSERREHRDRGPVIRFFGGHQRWVRPYRHGYRGYGYNGYGYNGYGYNGYGYNGGYPYYQNSYQAYARQGVIVQGDGGLSCQPADAAVTPDRACRIYPNGTWAPGY